MGIPQKKITDTWESLSGAQGYLTEVACLLSDPEVSIKLSEGYYRKEGGKILKRLIRFFDHAMNDEDFQMYLLWYELRHFWRSKSMEEINSIEETFLTNA